MKQIDMNSQEFLDELKKTEKFTQGVVDRFGWSFNPNPEVNEAINLGLARHKLLYGKRFCPCFMVVPDPEKEGKYKSADDRICPCKPAIEDEIPNKGVCHCGIFCTKEYAENNPHEG
jgi:ferredoxin-thioredoxin reductase catalytic subunit